MYEHADEIVSGSRLALGHHGEGILGELAERPCRPLDLFRLAAQRGQHAVGPAQQLIAVSGRDAEHVADHD